MATNARTWGAGLLAVIGFAAAPAVQAQVPNPGGFNFAPPGNFNPYVVNQPGLSQAAYLANLQAMARAAQVQPAFSPLNRAAASANPYLPFSDGVTGAQSNPYDPAGSSYPNPWTNPYYPYYTDYGAGSVLRGQADVMRAYGSVITSQETARIMREAALQARLDTKKKTFDLDMYIKANTPTFTEEQAKIARMTLKRIQSNSSEPEIASGKSLNLLLDDLRRYPGKKPAIDQMALPDEMLNRLNVTKGFAGLGILRDDGKFTWPVGIQDMFPPEQLKIIENQAYVLVKGAANGKVDGNVLKEMSRELARIRDQLFKKVNEMPTTQYLEAKRFLNDFDDARIAVERGEAPTQLNYQKWAAGGKTLQQLVDYMVSNGLKFAPAIQGDEAAYRAVHSGMAALDVAMNTQLDQPMTTDSKQGPQYP
jgi:hypothetical protein